MADRRDELRARLMATFRVEAEEHVQALRTGLAALGDALSPGERRALTESTFREMHTLKGAARSVGLGEVEALCQACEAVLSGASRGKLRLDGALLEELRDALEGVPQILAGGARPHLADDLARRLEHAAADAVTLEAPAPPAIPAPVATPPTTSAAPPATLRVAAGGLDALTTHAQELVSAKLAAVERVREALELVATLDACAATCERTWRASRGAAEAWTAAPPGEWRVALRAAALRAHELVNHLAADGRLLAAGVDALADETRRLRLTPAASALELFPAMVRDLARAQGKQAEWAVHAADLEVDKRVLDALKEPLIHLVRNAVDHGIEAPAARLAAGKPACGRVSVTLAPLEGARLALTVEDDGQGIALDQVQVAAVRAGFVAADGVAALGEQETLELVCRSGLSTAPIITEVSGHGLGLAIVKESVERLGGRLGLETRAGRGTTVALTVPASIATFRGLLVRADEQRFLVPTEAVERAIRLAPEETFDLEGRRAARFDGQALFLARLAEVLDLSNGTGAPAERPAREPCLVLRSGEQAIGLLVDEVLGEREVTVKELRAPLVRVRNISGAGLLGTGELVLILRPADLLRSSRRARRAAAEPARPTPRVPAILVVDDSITTRTMEKNLLEAAGYRVGVAVDGLEAWTALRTERYDLVVSDLDMPRLDGFLLTERIRADPALRELPVVLVTALEAREDKERGVEVGANAYVVKSSFDQSNLLEIVRRLV